MDRIFMDEYYEHLRADNIEAFSKERNDEYVVPPYPICRTEKQSV